MTNRIPRTELFERIKELDDLPLDQSSETGFLLLVGALRILTTDQSSSNRPESDELLELTKQLRLYKEYHSQN